MEQVSEFDIEDVEDILKEIEASFNIKFAPNELAHVSTFGQLCDEVGKKITLSDSDGCTTQQAFYKVREAIPSIVGTAKENIKVDTKLESIFPRQRRRKLIKQLEKSLEVKLGLLQPKNIVIVTIVVTFLGFLACIYFNWKIGLSLLAAFIIEVLLSKLTAKEFDVATVGELSEKMVAKHYLKSRRNPLTVNKAEISKMIEYLFNKHLFPSEPIKPQTIIVDRKVNS